jgi:ubiquinol-cytochrome c reductase iron-sulfur subunit
MSEHVETPPTRRDFLFGAVYAAGAGGVLASLLPLADTLAPAADTLALASIEVDLAPILEGQAITVMWQGKAVFVRHRTPAEIAAAREADVAKLRDPQTDADRVLRPEWLVAVGVCTHLGCVPLGQRSGQPRGDHGGWFCPCHGAHYDTSGRVRKGPAPANLAVPPYVFLDDTRIRIG